MKPATTILAAAVVAIVASYVTVKTIAPALQSTTVAIKETATQRINRTGVIRCGYVAYPPYLMKDANTNKMSGIFNDLTEKMASIMGVKVEWAFETSFANFTDDLKAGRFDVYCGGLWPEAMKSRMVDYTVPVTYVGLGVYVRADDTRFDNDVMKLNDNAYKLSTQDGEMSDLVAREDFPSAQTIAHPHNSDFTLLLMDVATGKSDALVMEKAVADGFNEKNNKALKNLVPEHPIRLFGNTWAMTKGNQEMINAMNTTLVEMINTGFVDKTLRKYDPDMSGFYPVALPFRPAE